jgi:superkiller protein 3
MSQLTNLYNEIVNHRHTSDKLRRTTESKLPKHKQVYRHALPPSPLKFKTAEEVDELVKGAITLGIQDELAWMTFLEGKDCDSIGSSSFFLVCFFMQGC